MRLTMKVNGRSTALFLATMLLFCIQSLTLRLIGTDHAHLLYHIHALLLGGAVFATVLAFWHYSSKVLLIYEFLIFLGTSSAYAPLFYGDGIFTGIMVSEAFLFYTLAFGTALFIARLIRRRLRVAETFLTAAFFLVAMISCGSWIYTAVSGALPSCDVILAIFQTHWQEAFDFLKMQRLRDVIVVSITVLFVFWLCRRLSRTIVRADVPSRPSHPAALILGILLLGYSCVRLIPENRDYYAVNLFKMVSNNLGEFLTYQRTVEKRMARLLAAPTLNAGAGVYRRIGAARPHERLRLRAQNDAVA